MKTTKDNSLKDIFVHWRNFLFVIIGLLLAGIIIGFIVTPLI
jgi:hypothetical protein